MQQMVLYSRDDSIRQLEVRTEDLSRLFKNQLQEARDLDEQLLKYTLTNKKLKSALYATQAQVFRDKYLFSCKLQTAFSSGKGKSGTNFENVPALQLLKAVQWLDVDKALRLISKYKSSLPNSFPSSWYDSDFHPILLQTSLGQNLAHAAIMASFLRDGHSVGILSYWDNPMRYELRNVHIQKMDRLVNILISKLISVVPMLVSQADANNLTPLHLAAHVGLRKTTYTILSCGDNCGIDIDAQDSVGQTALHKAIINDDKGMQDLLISFGAHKHIEDDGGNTFTSIIERDKGSPRVMLNSSYNTRKLQLEKGQTEKLHENIKSVTPAGIVSDKPICQDANGGWNVTVSEPLLCEIDQIDVNDFSADEWFEKYYLAGRPVVIRNFLDMQNRCRLSKQNVMKHDLYQRKTNVGPSAYPHLTGQFECPIKLTIKDLEKGEHCFEDDYEIIPNMVFKSEGKQFMPEHWNNKDDAAVPYLKGPWLHGSSFQLFVGGKDSGAAMHFHGAAYNIIFFGQKHWRLLPPHKAGLSGIPSKNYFDMAGKKSVDSVKSSLVLHIPPTFSNDTKFEKYSYANEKPEAINSVFCAIPVEIPDMLGIYRLEATVHVSADYNGPSILLDVRCQDGCTDLVAEANPVFQPDIRGVEQHIGITLRKANSNIKAKSKKDSKKVFQSKSKQNERSGNNDVKITKLPKVKNADNQYVSGKLMTEALMEVERVTEDEAIKMVLSGEALNSKHTKAFQVALNSKRKKIEKKNMENLQQKVERAKRVPSHSNDINDAHSKTVRDLSGFTENRRHLNANQNHGVNSTTGMLLEVLLGPQSQNLDSTVVDWQGEVRFVEVRLFGPTDTEAGRRSDLLVNSDFYGKSLAFGANEKQRNIANYMEDAQWFQRHAGPHSISKTMLEHSCVAPHLWKWEEDVERNLIKSKTCTQNAGDLMLLPPQWGHSTLNPGFVIGYGNLWNDAQSAKTAGAVSGDRSVQTHISLSLFWEEMLGSAGMHEMDNAYNNVRKTEGFALTGGKLT
jgi:hypothetical protein